MAERENIMELINNRESLAEALNSCEGCVIYGAGLVGTCLIQYLSREKLSSRIICIAVKSREGNPVSILGIPVYELSQMEHYRAKYLFLIATLEHLQEGIRAELGEFGCERIAGLSNVFYARMREEVNDFTPDILCMLQKGLGNMYANFAGLYNQMGMVKNELLRELTFLIEEQNEISAVNTKAFAEYQNCYRGRDVVVVATGPTLNDYEPIEGAKHVGVNTSYKNPKLKLDYLFVQDGRPEFLERGKFEGLEDVKCKVFMGRVLKGSNSEQIEFPEEYRRGENIKEFILDHAWSGERIYRDLRYHPIAGGYSVIFSALHFALYTYPKKIYLVGCDNAPTGYYDGTVDKRCLICGEIEDRLKAGYLNMKKFAQMHYPRTEIISINPVGLKGMFEDLHLSFDKDSV